MIRWFVNMVIASMIFSPTQEFSFEPKSLGLDSETVILKTEDQTVLFGWFLPAGQSPDAHSNEICLLFFHGNAGNISDRLPEAKEWVDRGVCVFLIDYRGYGKSEGRIRLEADLYRDGRAALQWLHEKKGFEATDIILYGESLGAVLAVQFGTEQPFKAVILEAPFTAIREMGRIHHPVISAVIPEIFLRDFEMDNERKISKLKAPVLIIHGTRDGVTPFSMGKWLFNAASSPKEFLEVPGAGHNDLALVFGTGFYDRLYQFAVGREADEIQVDLGEHRA